MMQNQLSELFIGRVDNLSEEDGLRGLWRGSHGGPPDKLIAKFSLLLPLGLEATEGEEKGRGQNEIDLRRWDRRQVSGSI